MNYSYKSYLAHHSIKGQKWGVKHGPPYPIQKGNPVTIKKGTKLTRLSLYDESNAEGHAYVNYNENDVERYKGFFASQLLSKGIVNGKKVYVHEMEAAKDLRSPSQQERIDIFIDMYKNDPVVATELAKYHKHDESNAHAWLPEFAYRYQYNHLDDEALKTKGYATFVKSIGGNEYTRDKYFKELKNRGYDFVRDDQDSGVHGVEPSIIIDRKASTIYKRSSQLPVKDIAVNYAKYGRYLDRGKRHKEGES